MKHLIILFCLSGALHAGINHPERSSNISREENLRHVIQTIRQEILLGQKGLSGQTQDWVRQSEAWLLRNTALDDSLKSSASVDMVALQNSSYAELDSLDLELDRLRIRSLKLAEDSRSAIYMLRNVTLAMHQHLLYPSEQQSLENVSIYLQKNFQTLNDTIQARYAQLLNVPPAMKRKVNWHLENKLTTAKIPGWQDLLAQLRDMFSAEALLDPIKAQVFNAVGRIRDLVFQLRVFAALDELEKLKTLCRDSANRIASAPVGERWKAEAQAAVASRCQESEQKVALIAGSPAAKRRTVIEFADKRARALRLMCSAGGAQGNCKLGNWLAQIPRSRIRAMDDELLREFEMAWTDASENKTLQLSAKLGGLL